MKLHIINSQLTTPNALVVQISLIIAYYYDNSTCTHMLPVVTAFSWEIITIGHKLPIIPHITLAGKCYSIH